MFNFSALSNLPHHATPFHDLKDVNYVDQLNALITKAFADIDAFVKSDKLTPKNTFNEIIVPLEAIQDSINYISNIYYSLYSADGTEEIKKQSEAFSEALTNFSSKFSLNSDIYQIVKRLKDNVDGGRLKFETEELAVLDKYYSSLVRNGAQLPPAQKVELEALDQELAKKYLKFSENLLKSTKQFKVHLTTKEEVSGIPDSTLNLMREVAKKQNQEGWVATLDSPIYVPILQRADNRALREQLVKAFATRATESDLDNRPVVKDILKLRLKRAQMLGYKSHADYILEKRMANSRAIVENFTTDLYEKSYQFAKMEFDRLVQKAKSEGIELKKWDAAYYSEKVKSELLSFNDETLKPYFPLPQVLDGLWKVANKLFNLTLTERSDLPTYHADVKCYEVNRTQNGKQEYIGLLYADFFTRDTKRAGAWMGSFLEQGQQFGGKHRPHVTMVCNFAPDSSEHPSLLSFQDVRTLFHEFGHALHGLLSHCEYRYVSGTNVYWDFVELPSQMMENWLLEKECLDLFAFHYQKKEKIPEALLSKMKAYQQFQAGLAMLRQLSFGHLDMQYHSVENEKDIPEDLEAFEREHLKKFSFMPPLPHECFAASFGHLFSDGGYAAGYYSYKWAEVLEADGFEEFKRAGIFNQTVAQRYVDSILSQGGRAHPLELFKKFVGRAPNAESLLKRSGLVAS